MKLNHIVYIFLIVAVVSCKAQSQYDLIFDKFEEWKVRLTKNNEFNMDTSIKYIPSKSFYLDTLDDVDKAYEEYDKLYGKDKFVYELPECYTTSFGDFNGDNKIDALFFLIPAYKNIGEASGLSIDRPKLSALILSDQENYYIDSTYIKEAYLAFENNIDIERKVFWIERINKGKIFQGRYLIWKDDAGRANPALHGLIFCDLEERTIGLYDDIGINLAKEIKF